MSIPAVQVSVKVDVVLVEEALGSNLGLLRVCWSMLPQNPREDKCKTTTEGPGS